MNRDENSLSLKDRDLIEKSETTLRAARPLLAWFRERWHSGGFRLFELDMRRDAAMQGFLDRCAPDGRETSVMGCIQTLRFHAKSDSAVADSSLRSFIERRFFEAASWTHDDGLPGGFGYTPLLARIKSDGSFRRLPEPGESRFPRLDQVGERYDWTLLQVDLHDFVRSAPALRRHARLLSRLIKEAAYIVIHPDFLQSNFPKLEGASESVELGYAFAPATVHPNIFGYGPGRFGAAFKLFRFAAFPNGDVEIGMVFMSAPRSERVFYFWGFDPFYSAVNLLDLLTFRALGLSRKAHDKMDTTFLRQHGMVHMNTIQGMRGIWENRAW